MNDDEEWDVFASCTGEDRDWVRPVVDRLSRRFRVFLDERSIEHGNSITDALRRAIGSSRVFVAFYSPVFTTRTACQWELLSAYLAVRAAGTVTDRILVVNPLDGVDHIEPAELRDARYVASTADPDDLVRTIAARLERFTSPIGPIPRADPGWWPRRRLGGADFVGRIGELWAVHSAMSTRDFPGVNAAAGPPLVQIRGLGGVGKSLLAEAYAARYGGGYPGGIHWIDVGGDRSGRGTGDAVLADHRRQLTALAGSLDLDLPPAATLDQVRGRLARELDARPGPYLWVLDDVPDDLPPDTVAALMPAGANGRTLMTTRYRGYRFGEVVDLDVLPERDALALLVRGRRVGEDEAEEARQLVRDLGGHALAVDLAAGCLDGLDGIVTFADLRAALARPTGDGFQELVDELAGEVPSSARGNIAATLRRSIDRLGDQGLDVLLVAASLASSPIPGDVFGAVIGAADGLSAEVSRRYAAAGLRQADLRSLARLDLGAGGGVVTCQVHSLVVRAVRLAAVTRARRESLREAATPVFRHRLAEAGPAPVDGDAVLPHARALAQAAAGSTRQELELIDAVARSDYDAGAYTSSLAMYEREHRVLRESLGDRHQFTLQTAGNVASVLSALGRLHEAAILEREVLAGRTETLGDDDERTLLAANNLTLTLRELGRPSEAADLLRFVADAHRRSLGPDHLQTLTAEANLASVLNDVGRYDQALQIQQRVGAGIGAALGPDHPRTLWVVNTMTTSLQGLGRITDALRLGAEVHRRRKAVLGPEHPDTLMTAHNVAALLRIAGRLDRARELQEEILGLRQPVLGPTHPETLATVHNLASTLADLGLAEESAALRRTTWEQLASTLGEDHPSSLTALSNLSFSLREQGRDEEAAEAEERAWRGRVRHLGHQHPHTAASAEHLHPLTRQLGRDQLRAELEASRPELAATSDPEGPQPA